MSPTLIATLAGLLTAIFWGTSDYLSAKSSKKLGALEINFVIDIIGIFMAAIIFLLYGVHLNTVNQFVRIILCNVFLTMSYVTFLKALSSGNVGIIVPIGNTYPLFTIGLSLIFLNDKFRLIQLLAMLIIVLGAVTLAYEKNHRRLPLRELHRGTLLAVAAAFFGGTAYFVINPIVTQISWQTVSVVGQIFSTSFATLIVFAHKGRRAPQAIKRAFKYKPLLILGVIGIAGNYTIYLGSSKAGNVAIPTVLTAAGPLIASFWAAVLDHEKLGVLKRVGAVVVIAGIVILNIA